MELSVVLKREADGTYVAISPTLPQCVTRGKSPKEALDEHRKRIRRHIAIATDSLPDSIEFHIVGEV